MEGTKPRQLGRAWAPPVGNPWDWATGAQLRSASETSPGGVLPLRTDADADMDSADDLEAAPFFRAHARNAAAETDLAGLADDDAQWDLLWPIDPLRIEIWMLGKSWRRGVNVVGWVLLAATMAWVAHLAHLGPARDAMASWLSMGNLGHSDDARAVLVREHR